MGTAIAGTIPIGALAAYLMYLWTSDKSINSVGDTRPSNFTHDNTDTIPETVSWKDIEQTAHDAVPIVIRFLSASWNLFMKGLTTVGIMPVFRRTPWLLVMLIVVIMALIPPVGIFLFIIGIVALDKGAKVENDFRISL